MRLCTTAQLVGGPFDESTIDLMSTPNGVGIVIGGIFGRTGQGLGFFGRLIAGTVVDVLMEAP
jgi:hypothetical protein